MITPLTDQDSDCQPYIMPYNIAAGSSAESILLQIKDMIRIHYSYPRRDITDYIFKKSIKTLNDLLRDPLKKNMMSHDYLKHHLEFSGKIQQATIEFFFTRKINFKKYNLPRKLSIKHMIKSLFPVVVQRVQMMWYDRDLLQRIMKRDGVDDFSDKRMDIEEKKYFADIRHWVFGVKFRCGKYWGKPIMVQPISAFDSYLVRDEILLMKPSRIRNRPNDKQLEKIEQHDREELVEVLPYKCKFCKIKGYLCCHVEQPNNAQDYVLLDSDGENGTFGDCPVDSYYLRGIDFEKTMFLEQLQKEKDIRNIQGYDKDQEKKKKNKEKKTEKIKELDYITVPFSFEALGEIWDRNNN